MKIAIINTFDAKDVRNWAGIPYHIAQMLDTTFNHSVKYIRVSPMKRTVRSKLLGFYFNRIRRKRYYTWADRRLLQHNENIYRDLQIDDFDLIITFEFYLIPLLKNRKCKIIYWNDATFKNLINFYAGYSNISTYCIAGGHHIQKEAFKKSDFVIFSSQWAINTAINFYEVGQEKLKRIAFASNLTVTPSEIEAKEFIELRKNNGVKLLFLASEWERKGGELAIEVNNKLNERGIDCVLYVVGGNIPEKHQSNPKIKSFGFLRKNVTGDEGILIRLLKESTFLILPTKADCTPVAFSEANSYGLPVIATNIGGIPSIISKNKNGYFFEIHNFIDEATNYITQNLPSTERYTELCHSSLKYYQDEMSWSQVEHKLASILKELNLN